MEKGASFLFAGIHFDKKRFAADFSRFEVNVCSCVVDCFIYNEKIEGFCEVIQLCRFNRAKKKVIMESKV